jgi:hypothetical protein
MLCRGAELQSAKRFEVAEDGQRQTAVGISPWDVPKRGWTPRGKPGLANSAHTKWAYNIFTGFKGCQLVTFLDIFHVTKPRVTPLKLHEKTMQSWQRSQTPVTPVLGPRKFCCSCSVSSCFRPWKAEPRRIWGDHNPKVWARLGSQ